MKIDVTDHSAVKKSLAVEVDADEVARETDKVLRDYARHAKIPGFRPGKAPMSVIRSRFGKEARDDVRDRVMSRTFREAAREKGLKPVADPQVDEVSAEDGEPLRYKVTFEVLPELEPKGYKGLEVRRPKIEVLEPEIDEALEEIRQSRATLQTVEGRKAATGDVVVADVRGVPAEGEPFERERMMLEVGSTQNLPAFNEGLEGVESGRTVEFSVDYPEAYGAKELAGKTVAYTLSVHEIKVRQVPELDDEFAKDLGDFADLAALRGRIAHDLEHRKEHDAERAVRQSVIDKALVENPVMLPEALVDDEVRHRLEEIVRNMAYQGIDPEKLELDWKELRDKQVEPARKSVHARLLLDAVARVESIQVEPSEVDERIARDAKAMGEEPRKLKQVLQKDGRLEALKSQLLREKALDLMIAVANIQNEE